MTAPDLSEFQELSHPRICKVGLTLDGLDVESRAQLEAALSAPRSQITTGAIMTWLERRGIDSVSIPSITTHRKGRCVCVRG